MARMSEQTVESVLSGGRSHAIVQGDSLAIMAGMPKGSVDLVFGSPPYEDSRHYAELAYRKKEEEWVAWMVELFRVAIPITKGLVAMVVGHGKTRHYEWSAVPSMLEADLHRAGFRLRCPVVFARVGIPGSGGKDYFRYDHEWIVVAQNPEYALDSGRIKKGRLPWSNNTACGHAPKWAPGGELSHRLTDGQRRNQWGGAPNRVGGGSRRANGERQSSSRPSHQVTSNGETDAKEDYVPPALANPGTVVQESYTAEQVAELLSRYEGGTIAHHSVGGGHMGHALAHDNEAPFPLSLAERFVLSFVPPGGIVLDPFCGSGTTIHAAVENRRRGIGIDLRSSQVELARRRILTVAPRLIVESDDIQRRMATQKGTQPEEPDVA